jgi:hypothetical protein
MLATPRMSASGHKNLSGSTMPISRPARHAIRLVGRVKPSGVEGGSGKDWVRPIGKAETAEEGVATACRGVEGLAWPGKTTLAHRAVWRRTLSATMTLHAKFFGQVPGKHRRRLC